VNEHLKQSYPFLPSPVPVTKQDWNEDVPPLLSVRCKTYMHAAFIRKAIEGFLMQETTFRVEVLIHDDASNDGTAEIVKEYASKYPQLIKATCQIENQYKKNPKTAKYIKPPASRGKYIAKCEGDDYWTDPLKLQVQVEFLEAHPDYSMSCGGFQIIDTNKGNKTRVVIKKISSYSPDGFTFTLNDMTKQWLTKTLTVVYRKSAMDVSVLKKYKYRRDVHFNYHLIKSGKGYYHNRVFGVYHVHGGGIFSPVPKIEKADYHVKIYEELYEHNRDEFTRKTFLKAILIYFFHRIRYKPQNKQPHELKKLFRQFCKLLKVPSDIPFMFVGLLRLTGLKKRSLDQPLL